MNRDGIRKEGIHALDFASKRSREMFNLEQVIKQSAFTTTTATLTAIETTIEVTRSPGTSRLGHFETSHPNHPPIDQFTPEHSVRSDCFASKLKAISTRQLAEA